MHEVTQATLSSKGAKRHRAERGTAATHRLWQDPISVVSQNGCQCIPPNGTCVLSMSNEVDANAEQQHYYGCQPNSLTHGPWLLNPGTHSCTRDLYRRAGLLLMFRAAFLSIRQDRS